MAIFWGSYRHTTCGFLESVTDGAILAFDAGWPCSLLEYQRMMKQAGLHFDRIRWALVSHFHMDHAGLVGEFQDAGITCLVFESQGSASDILAMETIIRRSYPQYRAIQQDRLVRGRINESRAFLASVGIHGEIVGTPSHSSDSLSLVTDEGEALVGDLSPPDQVMPDNAAALEDWSRLRGLGVRRVIPAHAAGFSL